MEDSTGLQSTFINSDHKLRGSQGKFVTHPRLTIQGRRLSPQIKNAYTEQEWPSDTNLCDVGKTDTTVAKNPVKTMKRKMKKTNIIKVKTTAACSMAKRKNGSEDGRKFVINSRSVSPIRRTQLKRQQSNHSPTVNRRSRGRTPSLSASGSELETDNLPAFDSRDSTNASLNRIRCLVTKLRMYENVPKKAIVANLEYFAKVLENIHKKEAMRIIEEEDDELSETETLRSVPIEVRDWLTMTFTRSVTNVKKTQDRLHFRSVANVIRAGIVVDRIYRRMSSSIGLHVPPNVLFILKNIEEWSFDVFEMNEVGEGHALKYVGYELLQKYDLISKFKISAQSLETFLFRLEQGYSKFGNPYHNLLHAADVVQTTYHLFSNSGLVMWLTDLEIFAVLVAAMIHDFEHTGTTNAFHINTSSEIALTYNDRAVLESFHTSAIFRLMKEDEDCNIISGLKKEEYKEFRSMVIEIVLATDMSFHFQQVKNMKTLLAMPENIDKSKALSLLVHCADISHPTKKWNLHSRWTDLLVEEFFKQGDKEKELGLAISPLCDRNNTMISQSQIGFIDFIVDPSFQVMGDMLDKIIIPLKQKQKETISKENTTARRTASITSLDSTSSDDSIIPKSLLDQSSKDVEENAAVELKKAGSTTANAIAVPPAHDDDDVNPLQTHVRNSSTASNEPLVADTEDDLGLLESSGELSSSEN